MALESRTKIDFIVGIFVMGAIFSLVFLALRAANLTEVSGNEGYAVQVRFENIGTITERAAVKSSGVLVGRVKSIKYNSEEFIAEVSLVIDEKYRFPEDSIFSIVSSNLLGGQYISIEVGGADETLADNAVIEGNSALILEHLISKFLFEKGTE